RAIYRPVKKVDCAIFIEKSLITDQAPMYRQLVLCIPIRVQ
ncbi:MAG: hypothetical protein ACI80S_002051, partial [Pseudohongiellaceae bacterium]